MYAAQPSSRVGLLCLIGQPAFALESKRSRGLDAADRSVNLTCLNDHCSAQVAQAAAYARLEGAYRHLGKNLTDQGSIEADIDGCTPVTPAS